MLQKLPRFDPLRLQREVPWHVVVWIVDNEIHGEAWNQVPEPAPHDLQSDARRRIYLGDDPFESSSSIAITGSTRESELFQEDVQYLVILIAVAVHHAHLHLDVSRVWSWWVVVVHGRGRLISLHGRRTCACFSLYLST